MDLVQLHRQFGQLRFRRGFDPIRYCADFENPIERYNELNTTFSDFYIATIFIEKIERKDDPSSPFSTFASTISTLPQEHHKYAYVKRSFIEIASNNKGPINPPTFVKGNEYILSVVDECTRFAQDEKNYPTWKLVIDTVIQAEASSLTNKKQGYLEAKTKELIVTSVCERVLNSLTECGSSDLKRRNDAICHSCKKKGHYAKNCPDSTQQNG
ncbi:hypothetical protein U1Q18_049607, partial [Sarracenia purpurea var. burkii]